MRPTARRPVPSATLTALTALTLATCLIGGPADGAENPSRVEHLRASSFSRSSQFEAALARTGENELTVVWTSRRQSNGHQGIYLQRLDANGAALGGEEQVHRFVETAHSAPAIAGTPGGGAIVVWQSFGQDGDGSGIIARRVGPNGERFGGDEFPVNERAAGEQSAPVVAVDAEGTAWFAWVDDERAIGVRAMRADGSFGPERTLPSAWRARTPSIACAASGEAVVVWTEDGTDGRSAVRVATIGPDGRTPVEIETLAEDAYEATVAAGDGTALVTWLTSSGLTRSGLTSSASSSWNHTVWAMPLDGRGCAADAARPIAEGVAASPVATADGFAVAITACNASPDDQDLPMRTVGLVTLDERGAARSPVVSLTDALPGEQSLRLAAGTTRVATLPGHGLAIAWDGDAGLDDTNAVHVTLHGASRPERPAAVRAGVDPKALRVADGSVPEGSTAAPYIPPRFDARGVEHGVREIAVNDLGVGFDAILDTGWTPPDCNLAVGVDHIVAVTNGRVTILDKQGTQLFTDELEGSGGFWGSLGATGFVFDPECLYDTIHHRYWVIASEGNVGPKSYILIAVSDDDQAPGTWFKYRLETTSLAGSIFDSPNIAVDDEAVYVTGDGSLGNYQIFIWDKASMLVGAPPAIAKSLNYVTGPESCGIPPVMDPSAPGLYLLEHKEAASNTKVKFLCLTNPLTTPTLTSTEVTVPTYGPPEDAPQKGTAVKIENFEARFWSADYKNGSFWATHHINAARVVVRWYEFSMNGWPASGSLPTVRQQGTVDLGGTIRTFLSAIGADEQGNAALTFARSSPDEYISMATTYRLASDPLGTMRPTTIVKTNSGPYTEANRWGDYAAARRDPASPASAPVFWSNHEYAVGPTSWRSWVQAITLPGPSPDLNGDGSVGADDLSILLGAWGGSGPGDLDLDGTVGASDLSILLGAWG